MCSNLLWNGVEVEMMWIPSHVRLEGNELMDERARHAALIGAVFDRPFPPVNFRAWQICFAKRMAGKVGRCRHLLDSSTSYSRRFLFDLGLRVKGRTGNLFTH
jgi:hypothetical protein